MVFKESSPAGPKPVFPRVAFTFGILAVVSLMACGAVESRPTPQVQPATAAEPSPAIPQQTPTAGAEPVQPTTALPEDEAFVTVGGVSFPVETALTEEKRAQGLSNRDALAPGAGMLFVYSEERKRTFWMKDMRFPLDMIWIASDCTVAAVTENVPLPQPEQEDRDLPRFSSEVPVVHVLEINAGDSQENGITTGDSVVFSGSLAGLHGC